MDNAAFDALARAVGDGTSRRRALKLLGGGIAGTVFGLAGGGQARAYRRDCERFLLSGGKDPSDPIVVDDDLKVYLNGDRIFRDPQRGVPDDNLIVPFRAKRGDKLRIEAKDALGPCYELSAIWLHCRERRGGDPVKLTNGVDQKCPGDPGKRGVGIFFNKSFTI